MEAWLPLGVILLVFGLVGWLSTRSYSRHVAEVNAVNQAIVDTNREMIAELREIKQVLKDRPV
jgi:hypothetical protein